MKKFVSVLMVFIVLMSTVISFNAFSATVDDVKRDTNEIKGTASATYGMTIDIWNYINNNIYFYMQNTLYPAVQANANPISADEFNALKESIASMQTAVGQIDVTKGVEDFYASKVTSEAPAVVDPGAKLNYVTPGADEQITVSGTDTTVGKVHGFAEIILLACNKLWKGLGDSLKGLSSDNEYAEVAGMIDPETYATGSAHAPIRVVFVTLGYSLVLVFFAVNLIETTIKYEIFTLKGAVNTLGRLFIAKVFIDLSYDICLWIIRAMAEISAKVIGTATEQLQINMPHINVGSSDLWVIGPILDILLAIIIVIPLVFIFLIVGISICLVIIKLLFRSFELAMMVVVAPAFFACYSSETTKPYFKNFILTLIQVSGQIVFMAVVYYVGVGHLSGQTVDIKCWADVGLWIFKTLPNALLIIAMAIMMIKPPKVLTNLIR